MCVCVYLRIHIHNTYIHTVFKCFPGRIMVRVNLDMATLALTINKRKNNFISNTQLCNSILKDSNGGSNSFHNTLHNLSSLLPPSSMLKNLSDYIGPTQIIQDNLPILSQLIHAFNFICILNSLCHVPISRSFAVINLQSPFLTYKESQISGIRMRVPFMGDILLPTTAVLFYSFLAVLLL